MPHKENIALAACFIAVIVSVFSAGVAYGVSRVPAKNGAACQAVETIPAPAPAANKKFT